MPKRKKRREKRKKFWSDFKTFISKGNVVDLAVALVVGSAFNKIVSQLVDSFINPLISIFIGGLNIDDWKYVHKEAVTNEAGEIVESEIAFTYGLFLQTVLDFMIIALTVFIVVKLYTRLRTRFETEGRRWFEELYPEEAEKRKKEAEEAKRKEEEAAQKAQEQKEEIERLKREKEEMHWEYMKNQDKLLTEIRDLLAAQAENAK